MQSRAPALIRAQTVTSAGASSFPVQAATQCKRSSSRTCLPQVSRSWPMLSTNCSSWPSCVPAASCPAAATSARRRCSVPICASRAARACESMKQIRWARHSGLHCGISTCSACLLAVYILLLKLRWNATRKGAAASQRVPPTPTTPTPACGLPLHARPSPAPRPAAPRQTGRPPAARAGRQLPH